ncbi:hypothetical protein CEXT_751611 [Caerostris extrusa]|uniref:Uncharacterized protein n=1 Tax=Caerostris extrusa TaxID=172846 RepID=A0AAV4NMP4_CAEEX|nr:hypothetical protein CEXT_751611 [Caerostris extrusa]
MIPNFDLRNAYQGLISVYNRVFIPISAIVYDGCREDAFRRIHALRVYLRFDRVARRRIWRRSPVSRRQRRTPLTWTICMNNK